MCFVHLIGSEGYTDRPLETWSRSTETVTETSIIHWIALIDVERECHCLLSVWDISQSKVQSSTDQSNISEGLLHKWKGKHEHLLPAVNSVHNILNNTIIFLIKLRILLVKFVKFHFIESQFYTCLFHSFRTFIISLSILL